MIRESARRLSDIHILCDACAAAGEIHLKIYVVKQSIHGKGYEQDITVFYQGRGQKMRTFTFVIGNKNGLGSGPAVKISREAEQYKSRIFIEQKGIELSARSLMGLLALQAACGDTIKVTIVGSDESAAEEGMKKILRQELGSAG